MLGKLGLAAVILFSSFRQHRLARSSSCGRVSPCETAGGCGVDAPVCGTGYLVRRFDQLPSPAIALSPRGGCERSSSLWHAPVSCAVRHHGPQNADHLVGQSDGHQLARPALQQFRRRSPVFGLVQIRPVQRLALTLVDRPSDSSDSSAVFPLSPLQGDVADPVRTANNGVIGVYDTLLADARSNAPQETLLSDQQRTSSALNGLADAVGALGVTASLSQAEINSFQSGVLASGLPASETEFLLQSGVSPANVGAITNFTATVPINLSVSSISVDELLRTAAQSISVPEPPTFLLLSVGIGGMLLLARRPR
jgi:hypothetical protein